MSMRQSLFMAAICWAVVISSAAAEPNPSEMQQKLHEESLRHFEKAIFFKPREGSIGGLEETLAPLIVQEVRGEPTDKDHFTNVPGLNPDWGTKEEYEQVPVFFFRKGEIKVRESLYEHVIFLFFYRGNASFVEFDSLLHEARPIVTEGFGVRVLLGQDRLPLLWEIFSNKSDHRRFFVSKTLEDRARAEFGAPLPGRMFSIEKGVEDTSKVTVVRLVEDASVPMGPYIYLGSSPERDIATITCRCMPSQAREFVETLTYEMKALNRISLSIRGCGENPFPQRVIWDGTMYSVLFTELKSHADPSLDVDHLMRWPTMSP